MLDPQFIHEATPATMTTNAAERCRYPSKVCRNRRTGKRNGELHRFCEEHRIKANKSQKRWIKSAQRKWPTDVERSQKPASPAAACPTASLSGSTTVHTPVDSHRHEPQLQHQYPTPPSFTALLHPLSYWEPSTATSHEQLTKDFVLDWSWPAPGVHLAERLEYDLYEHEIEPVMIQL